MSVKRLKMSEESVGDVVAASDCKRYDDHRHKKAETGFCVTFELAFWEKIWEVEQKLTADLIAIDFKKDKNIAAVYNPLDYAAEVHTNYMRKFLLKAPHVLFLGMNPGLFGMCQTSASSPRMFP